MIKELHIVCLDVPWPADYGGAIDMMNRIRALKELGIAIHLHYFSYNDRGTPNELNQFCKSIHVYRRKRGHEGFSLSTPYIVSSREDQELIKNLKADDLPVLLEGIHCTGVLSHLDLNKRKVVVRMHNEESTYYRELSRLSGNPLHKIYYYSESRLLKKYTDKLPGECIYACISDNDVTVLEEKYQLPKVEFMAAYPGWQKVNAEEGKGCICLYHGNLSVPENEEAAIWLLTKVFNKIRMPLVIAGKKPTNRLQKAAHLCQHTCLIADPSETEMNDLIRKAQINVLPGVTKQVTGIRLKLLHALYEGRHCVVNEAMVAGTGLESACHVGTTANAFASIITQLYQMPFGEEEIRLRKRLLGNTYDNVMNARKLIQWLS